uniref:Lysosomal acid phosphatase n=1 Tax=Rhabditophanes sp. KR3021 TaxID=114890 RepID=A0AC35UHG5_9BILA
MKLWFIFVLILHISCIFGKRELKLVHTILRHGERMPLANYPRDVVDESYWDLPYGALTENGIKQVYQQGSRLRKRYVDDFKFISPKYNEISALSTSVERCLLSAGSFLSGLFSQKKIDDEGWSLNWTPIPVKTDYFGSDKECGMELLKSLIFLLIMLLPYTELKRYHKYRSKRYHLTLSIRNHNISDVKFFRLVGVDNTADFNLPMGKIFTKDYEVSRKGYWTLFVEFPGDRYAKSPRKIISRDSHQHWLMEVYYFYESVGFSSWHKMK